MRWNLRTRLILYLGLALLLGILASSFALNNLIRPVALVAWLLWRVLLSVDQQIYWGLLIASALFYAFTCLAQGAADGGFTPPPDSNLTLDNVNYWRTSIRLTADKIEKDNTLKRNLGEMLAAMHALRQPEGSRWKVYEALRQRQIPLPEHIHTFLFPAEPSGGKRSFQQVLQAIWRAPSKWVRRWTGRDADEYYESIGQVLAFMESSLEIKHDDKHLDGHFDAHNH